jgi:sporulation protein YlmC with PRC-barrel domain
MRIRKISEVIGFKVFTDGGDFFGQVEEANLFENKIESWRIRIGGNVGAIMGGARGVIVPHQFVRAINDVFIISKGALPTSEMNFEESSE